MKRFFLDTNILIYALDDAQAAKRRRAVALLETAVQDGSGLISYQVVQECLHLMLRKFQRRVLVADARLYLESVLMPLCRVFPSGELFVNAISIAAETEWSFYDSLIVSAAAAAHCSVLYTEDLQHGRVIRGVKIQNPFA